MKYAILLLLNFLILTLSWGAEVVDPSEGFVEDYGNDIGDRLGSIAGRGYNTLRRQSCERGSADELNGVNCSGGYQYVGLNVPEDVRAIENMEEELIFLEAARRTHRFSVCQKGLHDRYTSNIEERSNLHRNAFVQFNQVRDHVRELHGVITTETATIENVQQNFNYAEDRLNPAYHEAQRRRFASQGRRAEANQRLEALLSRMPLGNRPEMKAAMVELAAGNGEITKEAFDQAFGRAMAQLRNQTNQSLEFFRPIISTSEENGETKYFYRVNEDFKRDLINTGQIENVVNSLNMEQRYRDNFMCRIDTYYSTGPMVLEIAQIPLYFAGGYGLARLAVRAGVTAIRAASVTGRVAASGTQLAARAGLVGLEALDWAQVGADVQASCFPNEYTVGSSTGDCDPENEIFQVYQEASIAQCLTSSVLGIAPMVGAGAQFYRSARYNSRLINNATPDVPNVRPEAPTPTPEPETVIVVTGTRARGSAYLSPRVRDRSLSALRRRTGLREEQIQNMEFTPESVLRLGNNERIALIGEVSGFNISRENGRALLNLVERGNRGLDETRFVTRERELRRILVESGVPEDEVNEMASRILRSGALGKVPESTLANNSGLVISDGNRTPANAPANVLGTTTPNASVTGGTANVSGSTVDNTVNVVPGGSLSELPGLQGLQLDDVIRRAAPETNQNMVPFREETIAEIRTIANNWSQSQRQEINEFLKGLDPQKQRQYFLMLLNGEPNAILPRLRRLEQNPASRSIIISEIDQEISNLSSQLEGLPINDQGALELSARRSDLTLQRTLIDQGDNLEVTSIFSANAYNENFRGQAHSLVNSFSADIRVREGRSLNVCRGSYGTGGGVSFLTGGFLTLCRDSGYLGRGDLSNALAAPFDTGIPANLQGYSRVNRFELPERTELTLGRNGPVRYDKGEGDAITGSGGNGGSIEFFDTRSGRKPEVNQLRASVRPPICNRRASSDCERVFSLQESVRADNLARRGNEGRTFLERQKEAVDGLIRRLDARASTNLQRSIADGLTGREALNRLSETNPELISALNLRREIELKLEVVRGAGTGLDSETRALVTYLSEARSSGETAKTAVKAANGNAGRMATNLRQIVHDHSLVREYRSRQTQIDALYARISTQTPANERRRILSSISRLRGQQEDLTVALQSLSGSIQRAIPDGTNSSVANAIRDEFRELLR